MSNPDGRPLKYTKKELEEKLKVFFEEKKKAREDYKKYVARGKKGKFVDTVAPPTMSG
ncbi:hypothetical protein LCGC14_2447170, partial [marine sediment metagenome]